MKNAFILLILLILGVGYTYFDGRKTSLPTTGLDTTNVKHDSSVPAPYFSFTDIGGKTRRLDDFRGKAVVLNFWASWCAPCVKEMPQMFELARKTENISVFLFISLDEEKENIERFLKKYSLNSAHENLFIAIDTDKKISQDLFQTYKIPETYLIDSKGMIREKIIGGIEDWNGKSNIQKIENLIAD